MHHNYKSPSSPMVHVVVLILASGFLIMLCNATCDERSPRRLRRGQKLTGCMDGGIMRTFNSTWITKDCKECCCIPDGSINCCKDISKPVFADPKCEAVFNNNTCQYIVRRTDNSTRPCLLRGVM